MMQQPGIHPPSPSTAPPRSWGGGPSSPLLLPLDQVGLTTQPQVPMGWTSRNHRHWLRDGQASANKRESWRLWADIAITPGKPSWNRARAMKEHKLLVMLSKHLDPACGMLHLPKKPHRLPSHLLSCHVTFPLSTKTQANFSTCPLADLTKRSQRKWPWPSSRCSC